MANIAKWNAPSATVSALTTELNSLANNTLSAQSAAIANQTNLDIYVDIELVLASLSPTAGAFCALYVAEAIDGTNYPNPSGADQRLQTTALLAVFGLSTTAATAQRVVVRNVVIPPATFKLALDNQAGVGLGASGNSVTLLAYDVNLNA